MSNGARRTATLILRAWIEPERPVRLRVRVIEVVDRQELTLTTTTSPGGVCTAVEAWLARLLTETNDGGA